jgi:iron complex outermembrane receptor protein
LELETGTTTNDQGKFEILHYPKKNIHIQLSNTGYKPLNVAVNLSVSESMLFELEPSHIDLDEVMLSIPGGKLKGEQTVSITPASIKQLQQSGEVSLAQVLNNISGVDQLSTGSGIGKPIIRGLSGNRIVTYSQGIRVENQQWGAEHGLGLGTIGIEGIEVIKGPASLLYGSDAIGGVLYFVDERYAKHDEVAGYFSEQVFGNTSGASTQMGVKVHKGSSKVNAFGSIANHGDYKVPSGKRISNSQFNEKNLKLAYGLNKGLWISNIRYSFLENNFGITDSAEYHNERQALDILPSQLIRNNALSVENTVFTGASKVNLVLGLNTNDRKEFEDAAGEPALAMKLNTFTYNLKWFSSKQNKSLYYVLGSQGMSQKKVNSGEELLIPDA